MSLRRDLTIVVAVLAVATTVGAVVGFIRRRLERMDAADGDARAVDPDMAGRAIARDRAAAVNGNSR